MRAKDLFLALVSTTVLFVSFELIVRFAILSRDRFENLSVKMYNAAHLHSQIDNSFAFELDREVLWKFRNGLSFTPPGRTFNFSTDGWGHRIEKVASGPGVRDYTILSLGDSCTIGLEVPTTYTKLLGEMVARRDPSLYVRIVNGGTSGYTSEQGVRHLRQLLEIGIRPDLAIVHFGHNDATGAMGGTPDREITWLKLYSFKLRRYFAQSYALVWLYDRLHRETEPGPELTRNFNARVSPEDYGQNLAEIVKRLKDLGTVVVLVNAATVPPGDFNSRERNQHLEGQSRGPYNSEMAHVAASLGANLVDVTQLVAKIPSQDFFSDASHDPVHPGEFGHAVIARQIFHQLGK